MVTPRSLTVTTRTGLKLHASEWPSHHQQQTCIFLHGFAQDSRAWDPLARSLRNRYRVIALDFRGHGDSCWDGNRSYCHNALLDDLNALIDQLRLRGFHLVGHSMGARVAMLYTAKHPDTVSSLTIVDTGPEVGDKGVNRIRQDAEQQPLLFESQDAYFQWLRTRLPLASRDALMHRSRHGLKAAHGQWQPKTDPEFARILWRQDSRGRGSSDLVAPLTEELWDSLDHITCRTLVVRGQLSSILQQDTAERMVKNHLVSGKLITVPLAGHAVMMDNPTECSKMISRFIDTDETVSGIQQDGLFSAGVGASI